MPSRRSPTSVRATPSASGAGSPSAGTSCSAAGSAASWRPSRAGPPSAGGVVVGLLPGTDRSAANPYVTVAIPTGLGELRNALLVRSSDVVVSVGGSWGTLSEVALAVRTGVPVVAIGGWTLTTAEGLGVDDGPRGVRSPEEALTLLDAWFPSST